MKKILIVLIVYLLLFAGCENNDNNGNNVNTNQNTILTIKNSTDYNFTSVSYGLVNFGAINSGNDVGKDVPANNLRPIIFTMFLSHIVEEVICTTDALTCEEGKNRSITINKNTVVSTDRGITDSIESVVFALEMQSKND